MAKFRKVARDLVTGAVFIDSRVPDLQALIDGAKPGERVFVLDPGKDGLAQIAADLAAAHLSHLATIAIVTHGAPGSLQLGSTTLDDGDLAADKAALAAIGRALAPKGKLALYACDVAAGAAGKKFLADLSHAARGVDVAAATHTIGTTAAGALWTLDAATGAKATSADTPFTAAAINSYQGTLASSVTGQLIDVGTRQGSYYLNSNSTTPVTINGSDDYGSAVGVDSALGLVFSLQPVTPSGDSIPHSSLYIGSLAANAAAPTISTAFETYFDNTVQSGGKTLDQDTQADATQVGTSIAVDPIDHEVFVPVGSAYTYENGLLVMSYSVGPGGAVTVSTPRFLETTTGNAPPTAFDNGAAYYKGNVYIDDAVDGGQTYPQGIYRIPTNGSAPVSILNASNLGFINGLALDGPGNRLFFATTTPNTNAQQLYLLNNISSAGASNAPVALSYAGVTAPTYYDIKSVAYDENAHVLYVANDDDLASNTTASYGKSELDELTLSGNQVTAVTIVPFSTLRPGATTDGDPFGTLTNIPLSTLAISSANAIAAKGAATAPLAGLPMISDFDTNFLASASVTVTDAGTVESGDVLGLANGSTFTAFTATPTTYIDNGHTFNVSYTGGVLTIANLVGTVDKNNNATGYENTIAAYQQVLQDVRYQNNSTDTNTRTLTYQVNNGAIGNPSGTTLNTMSVSVALAQPPIVVSGGYKVPGDVLAGASATAVAPGALTGDTSPPGSGTLSVTAVNGSASNVGVQTTTTYGTLTLQSTGAYTYAASNTSAIAGYATGSHPTDTVTFVVSNNGGTTSESFNATIDRAPTGTGIKMAATEGKTTSGSGGAAFKNETDPDGDALTVASVSYTNPTTMMTTAGTVGTSLAGQYGELTLNANGSYSYVADQTVAFSAAVLAGQKAVDDFTYTSSDGLGGTTGAQTLEFDVTCYASGTRIRTARGDICVESLAVGDLVVTASGAARPIRWLGHRALDCRRHPRPHEAHPIRIAAHALAPNRPSRDLFVSPGHSICIDVVGEVLIPAFKLVNGSTIQQIEVDAVTYWHVELDSHDVILAEDLPAESYLDMGNRPFFAESAVVALGASPDAASRTHADFCRPFHMDGRLVEVVRAQVSARARDMGWRIEDQGLDDLHLLVDGVRVTPQVRGFVARFAIPAAARDVWLVSPTSIPATVGDWPDLRSLGACLKGFEVDDGFGACRTIAPDDPRLCVGFHAVERDGAAAWRWTAGCARLPTSLWADARRSDTQGDIVVRVKLAGPMLPRWIAPAAGADAALVA